jgi:curved DNA-binding protein CbpA
VTISTDTTVDYYLLLGCSSDATPEEIRAAYRDKIRLWHPDLLAGDTEDVRRAATEMTARLNGAYQCLSDPGKRSDYDTSRHTGAVSARATSTNRLVVTPQTLRCDMTPGDILRLTLHIRADSPPSGEHLLVGVSEGLVATKVTKTPHTAGSVILEVTLDTSRLDADRTYHIPIQLTWGRPTGTATLVVHTRLRPADSTQQSRRAPTYSSHRHRARRSDHRKRGLFTTSLGGVVLPLVGLAWASGLLSVSTPANPPLVTAVCAGVVTATIWLLITSRFLRQPGELARIGIVWGHLMRWSGWALIGGCAVFLGIPTVAVVLMAIIATPVFGLVFIAYISGRLDTQRD